MFLTACKFCKFLASVAAIFNISCGLLTLLLSVHVAHVYLSLTFEFSDGPLLPVRWNDGLGDFNLEKKMEICIYCEELRGDKIGCCGENHWDDVDNEVYDIPDFLRNPENLAMEIKMEKEKINKMVDRFLGWRLPKNFNPDAGISFKPEYNVEYMAKQGKPPMRHEPTGTNLFDAEQAREMIEYLLDESPNAE